MALRIAYEFSPDAACKNAELSYNQQDCIYDSKTIYNVVDLDQERHRGEKWADIQRWSLEFGELFQRCSVVEGNEVAGQDLTHWDEVENALA